MSRRSGRSKAYSDISDESLKASGEDDTNIYEAEGEDDDEQEITRCVCGQDELNPKSINQQLATLVEIEYEIKVDSGLFIQCDKCSVWQHGYCVGLFTDEDVPDKYWCELCKPDLHILVYEADERTRTFYKLVNDKRKKLLSEFITDNSKGNRTRTKRVSSSSPPIPKAKPHRKERRHLDDEYDEQLQKALRESAKESGIVLEEDAKNKKRSKSDESDESNKKAKVEKKKVQNGHTVDDNDEETDTQAKQGSKKSKTSAKTKTKTKKSSSPEAKSAQEMQTSRDNLINQASMPRYVSDKSSIYELRKRTGAILEWLGRSQLELEEQKFNKIELYSYKEKSMDESQEINEENNKVIEIFNENLKLMEKLTEKILNWEQKFGKYAP